MTVAGERPHRTEAAWGEGNGRNKSFSHGSVGKESTCNAGDPGWIPGSGRSAGEGIGYPLQYSWASLVAQLVKNLPAVWETWVWSPGWEDPREGKSYPLQYSGLENSMDCVVHRVTKSWTRMSNSHFYLMCLTSGWRVSEVFLFCFVFVFNILFGWRKGNPVSG